MSRWFNETLKKRVLFGCIALLALAGAAAGIWAYRQWAGGSPDLAALRDSLRARLDPKFPGRGVTDYPGNTSDDVSKAYAMVLKAETEWARRTGRPVSELAVASGMFLLEHSDERRDGFPGWGVPIAWDPYGDGSVNPAHTKYTISTGIAIDALLDWAEVDPKAPRARIFNLMIGAARPYLREGALSPSGLLPYSLEAVDRPYDTFNPAAYLAGVMQRLSGFPEAAEIRDSLRAVADKTIEAHLAQRRSTQAGAWYWNYSINENVPNDLAHAGYVIYGLRLYAQEGGKLAGKLDVPAIEKHLADFVGEPADRLFAWPMFRQDTNTPARSYDLGMGLYLTCVVGRPDLTRRYARSLARYRAPEGAYLKYPPDYNAPALSVREYEAYILLGLSRCAEGPAQ